MMPSFCHGSHSGVEKRGADHTRRARLHRPGRGWRARTMATFLICHGAWSAGWAWKKVRPLLRAAGHEVFTPTYTGLGERAHQASPAVDLETHIRDVLGVVEFEGLTDIALVGHSYGG